MGDETWTRVLVNHTGWKILPTQRTGAASALLGAWGRLHRGGDLEGALRAGFGPSRSRTLKAQTSEVAAALRPALGHAPHWPQSGRAGLPAELEGVFCSFQKLPGLFLPAPNTHIPHMSW